MKKIIIFFVCMFSLVMDVYSQFESYGLKYGLSFSLIRPETEFKNNSFHFSYLLNGYFKKEISSVFEGQLEIGYGTITGDDFSGDKFSTDIIPISAKLILSPFHLNYLNPYLFSGIGYVNYSVTKLPVSVSPYRVEKSAWSAFVPIGGGLEFKIASNVQFDISGSYNLTFTDDLNYYSNQNQAGSANDGYFNFGIGITYISSSSELDDDNDGLTNGKENEIGTNPNDNDTDDDGLKDGVEVTVYNTSPFSKDSDKDGLTDFEEVTYYNCDPNKIDSDSDGLTDSEEVLDYKTNPKNKDTDGDKIDDRDEVKTYLTDPINDDSDNDGLIDSREIFDLKTDPNNEDSDGDTLNDSDEINIYGTDPTKKDTDNGSTNDNIEIKNNTNPRNPKDDVVNEMVEAFVLEGLKFKANSSTISSGSEAALQRALNFMLNNLKMRIEIRGHTDNRGSKLFNLKLSQRRADAVRDWLISRGIDSSRIFALGYGSTSPIASNETVAGRAKNRRVEIVPTK